MSGIYIKGMEMTKNCDSCMFSRRSIHNIDWCVLTEKDLPCDCPIVPVPPHGDLIDLSAKVNAQYYDDAYEEWSIKTVTVEDVLYGICEEMPPTIIPAEEGE